MNEIKKIGQFNFGWPATALRRLTTQPLRRVKCATIATAVLLCLATIQRADAQGDFQFQYEAAAPSGGNFPAHPSFDPNVQPAELLVRGQPASGVQQANHQDSPEAMVGSAGQMISSMSSSIQTQWQEGQWKDKVGSYFQNFDATRMFGSLALVLGGYFSLVWVSRQFGGGNGKMPKEVVEVLGQTPFGPKKHLQIVRLGSKLLLLINGPEGTHPIGEITDPEEVEYLASLCSGRKTANAANVLRIAKAATSRNATPDVAAPAPAAPMLPAAAIPTAAAAITAAAPLAAAAINPALAANPNHLAAILQSLNGQSGNAAVFEA